MTGSANRTQAGATDQPVLRKLPTWRLLSERVKRSLMPADWPARLAIGLGVPTRVQVERHELTLAQALGEAAVLRIAFASDFHAGPTTPDQVLRHAVAALDREAADVLLLGGDFVSLRPEYVDRVAPLLGRVHAPLGRYAVLGNHDHWAGAERVTAGLAAAGIQVLTNRWVQLPAPFTGVSVCGLDDHTSGQPDAAAALAAPGPVRILIMHAPSGLVDAGPRPFTVAFCGHTHGGQIALPGGRPLIVAEGPLSRRYNRGRYELAQGRTLFVSCGIGCTALPVRINAPAAILGCTVRG
jgi:predicted MPP superfamily phosphohydrolase